MKKIIGFIVTVFLSMYFFMDMQSDTSKLPLDIHSIDSNKEKNITSQLNDVEHKKISESQLDENKKPTSIQKLQPEIQNALNRILNTSSEGLIEVKTDKGDMVDLKNRFRTAPVATINETGEVVIQDYVSPPGN